HSALYFFADRPRASRARTGALSRCIGLNLVVDDHWSMIAPALVVARGAVNGVVRDLGRECRSHHLVVDAPAGVIVEGLAAVRPPRVRALDLAVEGTTDIDPAMPLADRFIDTSDVDAALA